MGRKLVWRRDPRLPSQSADVTRARGCSTEGSCCKRGSTCRGPSTRGAAPGPAGPDRHTLSRAHLWAGDRRFGRTSSGGAPHTLKTRAHRGRVALAYSRPSLHAARAPMRGEAARSEVLFLQLSGAAKKHTRRGEGDGYGHSWSHFLCVTLPGPAPPLPSGHRLGPPAR